MGWHWWPAPNAIATRPYRALNACTQRATCMWGCVEGAKGSVDLTHWPHNVSLGVQLITGARVRRLEINGRGLVTGATYTDREGENNFKRPMLRSLGLTESARHACYSYPRLLSSRRTGEFFGSGWQTADDAPVLAR